MKTLLTFLYLVLTTGVIHSQSLDDLSWISGYWTQSENGTIIEEIWTGPSGGMMVGMHKDVYPNGRSSFEFLRIASGRDGIYYLASPGGREAVPFKLKSLENQTAVFENPEHDFPVRIIYKRIDQTMQVRIEDASGEKAMSWTWTKTDFNY